MLDPFPISARNLPKRRVAAGRGVAAIFHAGLLGLTSPVQAQTGIEALPEPKLQSAALEPAGDREAGDESGFADAEGLPDPAAPGLIPGNSPLTDPTAPEGDGNSPVPGSIPDAARLVPAPPGEPALPDARGPVVMGTSLEPEAGPQALLPDGATEFPEEAILEATDPWVFTIGFSVVYDDNIRLSSRDAQADTLWILDASATWQWGDVSTRSQPWARASYGATGVVFTREDSENSMDHDLQAGGMTAWGRTQFGAEARFRRLSGATPDLGDRASREEITAGLTVAHAWSGRTFMDAGAFWRRMAYDEENLSGNAEGWVEGFVGSEWSGRTKWAAGGVVGILDPEGSERQDYQRALVRLNYNATGALNVMGKAGAEFRDAGTGQETNPVFALQLDWQPVPDRTRISLEGFRETVASASLPGENYRRTGLALKLLQQAGNRFAAGVDAGYELLSYRGVSESESSGRQDDYWYVRPSLQYRFDKRRRAEVFYQHRTDDSSIEEYRFTANQWGLSFGLDF